MQKNTIANLGSFIFLSFAELIFYILHIEIFYYYFLYIVRNIRKNIDCCIFYRMLKAQLVSVKRVSCYHVGRLSVKVVSEYRAAQVRKMKAQLMRSSRNGSGNNEGKIFTLRDDLIISDCKL